MLLLYLVNVIRQANIDDLNDVHDIETVSFKDPYPKGFLKALFQIYPETSFVAMKNDKLSDISSRLPIEEMATSYQLLFIHENGDRK